MMKPGETRRYGRLSNYNPQLRDWPEHGQCNQHKPTRQCSRMLFAFLLAWLITPLAIAGEKPEVVVSIKPLHSLVAGVLGETGQAKLLVDGNTSPHNFQLKPSQIKNLQKADIVFYIDNSLETFLVRAFRGLPKHVRKFAVAKESDLTILQLRTSGAWEEHAHGTETHHTKQKRDDDHHDDHDDGHHDDHHGHHDHGHGDEMSDMHVWLDPENARKIAQAIASELGRVYPENRDVYQANTRQLIQKLTALDAELKTTLAGVRTKPFIVFHDAYQYFERAYGLNAVGSITLDPNALASPTTVKEIRKKLQDTKAVCVFREPQFSDRLVTTVIEGSNARSSTLDPLGANLVDGKTLYFDLMRNLAKGLRQCLSGA